MSESNHSPLAAAADPMVSPNGWLRLRGWIGALPLVELSLFVIPMAVVVGSLCAAFLWSLDAVTRLRYAYPVLLYGLPIAGFAVASLYRSVGGTAEGGNNLIIDQIHKPDAGVPLRMAPLIFGATVITHLFGGSAGREGTAVQLGGSISSAIGRRFRLDASQVKLLLMAGIAAGFGAVFGTPLAGAVFALEVLAIGRIQYGALIPCLVAAVVGDWTCQAWQIEHVHYHIQYLAALADPAVYHLEPLLLVKVAVAGVAFGLAARLFAEANHTVQSWLKRAVPYSPLRAALGGVLVIGLVYIAGTRQYLGLGVWAPSADDLTIASFFQPVLVDPWSWAWKLLFTVVTLSAGFKGGEVTPLFYIGAALGNALGAGLGAPPDLFAGLGFVAVFAGASNTPLACLILGIELFGATHAVYIATACFLAYVASGHSTIYLSQRVGVPKRASQGVGPDATLREVREIEAARRRDQFMRLRSWIGRAGR